jgi:SAM-dependent methyltransferase
MHLIDEMQEYYARRAPEYDASMGYDDPERVATLARAVASITRRLDRRRVLELACGPGFWTQHVARVATEVFATDVNESTLAEARRKTFDGTVHFTSADAYALDGIPNGFDAALAVDWLAHVPRSRLTAFLETLHAHLADGALVIFCDQTPTAGSWESTFDAEGNHVQQRVLRDGSRYRVIKNFFDESELRALLAPSADAIECEHFPECRRMLVAYTRRAQRYALA